MEQAPGYNKELALFQREFAAKKPQDFLQFAANYFNRRLEQERMFAKNQEPVMGSVGGHLSPSAAESTLSGVGNAIRTEQPFAAGVEEEDVRFKSPFGGPVTQASASSTTKTGEESEGLPTIFKDNFSVTQVSESNARNPVDPRAPAATSGSFNTEKKISMTRNSIVGEQPLPMNFNALRRTSVSGETLKPDNLDDWTPEHYVEKSEEQLQRLEKAIGKNFLFNKLDTESRRLVINSLEEKSVTQGTQIIKQGDEGDYFYVVEWGTVEFYVNNEKVNTSGAGSSFGELALMYNSPRAATVVASTDCILWALDRLTFRRILLGRSFKKRILYDEFLKSVPVLKSLTTYDRAKLADALDTELYNPGQMIIREGDAADNFYFIEYGEAEVSKKDQGIIAHLKKGDYFGEVALLNDLPRQATVTAVKKTKVATLGKSGFQRLLGPAVEVLKLNDPTRSGHH
ncbi:LAMI_0G12794g1_1 [Lachancea mirantina]|uniref:cAMP-dependent protein kinase regulatory subunit n=1 Tax=Lachancea mirantina TaxID=1230905 RepID=A0A1G4KBI9_9SACH|nr:LAMI_0G12794g1_1 [Lachancea mirantina]